MIIIYMLNSAEFENRILVVTNMLSTGSTKEDPSLFN